MKHHLAPDSDGKRLPRVMSITLKLRSKVDGGIEPPFPEVPKRVFRI